MENKLELKHLAPYLPYGLNCKVELTGSSELPWYFSETGVYKIDGLMLDWMDSDEVESIKPILRPLSDLTRKKQIAEYFCTFYDHLERINPNTNETQNCALMLDGSIEMQYYNDYQFLFEWHFDVFGLIEKGLAINVNTL